MLRESAIVERLKTVDDYVSNFTRKIDRSRQPRQNTYDYIVQKGVNTLVTDLKQDRWLMNVMYKSNSWYHFRILFLKRSITISSVAVFILDSEGFLVSEPGDNPMASNFAFRKASASACSVDTWR